MRQISKCIWNWLCTPLFGTRIITKSDRVDPDLFSDIEFPLCCKKCGYRLLNLPEGQCSECGTSFDRGQRLVEQYVIGEWGHTWRRSPVALTFRALALPHIAFLILAVGLIGLVSLFESLYPDAHQEYLRKSNKLGGVFALVGVVITILPYTLTACLLAIAMVGLTHRWKTRKLRKRVLLAVQAKTTANAREAGEARPTR